MEKNSNGSPNLFIGCLHERVTFQTTSGNLPEIRFREISEGITEFSKQIAGKFPKGITVGIKKKNRISEKKNI